MIIFYSIILLIYVQRKNKKIQNTKIKKYKKNTKYKNIF